MQYSNTYVGETQTLNNSLGNLKVSHTHTYIRMHIHHTHNYLNTLVVSKINPQHKSGAPSCTYNNIKQQQVLCNKYWKTAIKIFTLHCKTYDASKCVTADRFLSLLPCPADHFSRTLKSVHWNWTDPRFCEQPTRQVMSSNGPIKVFADTVLASHWAMSISQAIWWVNTTYTGKIQSNYTKKQENVNELKYIILHMQQHSVTQSFIVHDRVTLSYFAIYSPSHQSWLGPLVSIVW